MKKGRVALLTFIIILSLFSIYIPKVYGGPATHFQVIVPSTAKIGVPFNITIKALDASNLVDTGYTGTVSLSVTTGFAIDPDKVTFGGTDAGVKTVSVTISANDLTNWTTVTIKAEEGSKTGTSSGIQVTGGNPTHLEIIPTSISGSNYSVGTTVTTGDADDGLNLVPFNSNEKAWDQDGNSIITENDYFYISTSSNVQVGDIRITPVTAGTPSVSYPAGSIVRSGDNDVGKPLTTLNTTNLKHLENVKNDTKYNYKELIYLSTDNAVNNGDTRGSTTPGFYNVNAGNPITFEVKVYDEWKNIVCDYNQNIVFNSSDTQAVFSPSNYTFILSDNGKHTFVNGVTLKTQGDQTINALDPFGLQDLMAPKIKVAFSNVHHFEFHSLSTTTPQAGSTFSFNVKAVDAFGNTVTNYTGTVHFSTTDTNPSVNLPSPPATTYNIGDAGDKSFSATLYTAGPQTIYVEDTSNPSIKGSVTLNVQPENLNMCHFEFDPIGPQTKNKEFTITIRVKNNFGNINPSFSGPGYNANLSVSSGTITPTSVGPFINGVWSGNVKIDTSSNNMTITAQDASSSSVSNGISNTFTVSEPDPVKFIIEPIGNQTRNVPFQITIKAVDGGDRLVKIYNDSVRLFVSTPGGTITPNTVTLTNGIWTGNVTLNTSDPSAKIYVNSLYGEYIYLNIYLSSATNVTTNNKRLTPVEDYPVNSYVGSSDSDLGLSLTNFLAREKHTENVSSNSSFDYGEYIYYLNNPTNTQVSVGDKRLTPYGNFRAGTYVQPGDPDVGLPLVGFNSNEKHTQHINSVDGYTPLVGESNVFSVSSGTVDHFEFSTISSPQTAGVPFSVTIYAKDSSGMTVTSFNQQVTISSSPTMGVSTNPSPVVFVNGVWSGTVTLNTPSTAVRLIATYGSITGESNMFSLQGTLNHFTFSYIPSPQKVGQSFFVEITARDGNENVVTNFSGNVNLTLNPSGPISPGTVGPFVNGRWSGYLTINSPFSNVQIIATDAGGSGMTGYSNTFSVLGPLDHFHFSSIGPQVSGVPFTIRIEAHDSQHNLLTNLNTTLTLSSSVGNIIPTTVNMVNGVFEGSVTLDTPTPSVFITASGLSKFGTSNNFSVSSGLHHFDFDIISSPQVAGTPFFVKIYAKDFLGNLITNFNATIPITATAPSNFVIEPTTVTFTNGVASGNITLYKAANSVQLRVEFASKLGLSNSFNVLPGPVHHFKVTSNDLDPVTGEYKPVGPQTKGCVFDPTLSSYYIKNRIRVTAVDQWDNKVTSYSGTIKFTSTDPLAILPPLTSLSDGEGVFGYNVTNYKIIMKTVGVHTITVTDTSNPNINGTSNPFTVADTTIHHFDFEFIGPQTINNPFTITIYAKDINGYIVSAWDDSDTWEIYGGGACNASLSASTGNISPGTTGNFTLGKWTGSVTLNTPHPNMKITATNDTIHVTGTSNTFSCANNVLFKFEFELISNQTAGVPFNITIKALDLAGSLITTWNGTALLSSSTGLGTITPSSTTSFTNGRWTGSVTINTPNPSVQIFAEDPVTHKMGMSNIFSVYGALDHFKFDTISSPQVAGTSFTIKIYAKDSLDYTIPNFTEQVNLSTSDGTINPTITGYFSGGIWIGSVTLTKAGTNIKIIAEKNGKTGESNAFTVLPGPVNNFVFSNIGPQTVGVPFFVTIRAFDEFGNLCTNFNGTATLSAVNSTVIEPTSVTFVNGVWSGNVKLGTHGTDVQLKITLATPSVNSLSNKFTVAKGLHHFLISTIGNQNKGVPFEITVTAKDEDNSTVTSFNGTVNLTCSLGTGTFEPTTLGPFVNGTFTGNIKINKPGNNVTITVTDPISGKSGTSNAFKVLGDKLIFKSTPQTIDLEQKSSPITIALVDPGNNPLIAPTNIQITLSTNSPTGKFSEDGTTWGVTTITFTSGSSEKTFYYKDSTPGAWDITVSATDYESAVQRIIISGKIADGSGQVTINPSSGLTNEKINITFTFTATYNLSGGAIKLTMPSGFPNPQLTDPNGDNFASVTGGSGVVLGSIQVELNSLIMNIQTMASGNTLTIKLNNVTLPNIEGNYTFSFYTMGQGGRFTPIANQPQFRVDRGFSLEILSFSISPSVASVNAGYTIIIRVGTKGELSVSDEINIKFPTGTYLPININTNLIKINGSEITTSPIVNQSANSITIKTPVPIPKETQAKIEISPQAGIINPPSPGSYKIEVTTNKETKPAIFDFVLSPAPPISDIEVNVKPQSAGKEAEYNILFRININLLEGDKIYIKFPIGTYIPPTILPTSIQVSGVPLKYEPLVIGRLLVLTLSAPIIKGENSIVISKSAKIKNPEIPDKYILYLYTSRDLNEVPSKPYEIVGTPYTIITVTPESPDGINGWYVTKPKIKLEGRGEGVIETYYYWDDEEPQLYTGEFSAKEGEHILYFYSKTKGLDNAEPVRSRTFKVDSIPPKITILEPTYEYTNKSEIIISGITEPTILVSAQTSRTTSNTKGQFNLIVKLNTGLNTIKVQAIDSAGNIGEITLNITLDTTPPYLELDPSITKWMEVFTEYFELKGKVEVGATLTINGVQVSYDSQGNFSYTVRLQEGNNSISIVAIDKAQNQNTIYLPIKYIKRTIVKIKIGSRTVYVNDRPIEIEAAPWIDKKSGRAMVPLRVIVEAFGATVEYRYISFGDERVSIIFGLKRIDLRIGSNIAYVEGLPVRLDAPPVIINGRTFVPIRFIMETFGAKVDWDPFTSEITITYPAP